MKLMESGTLVSHSEPYITTRIHRATPYTYPMTRARSIFSGIYDDFWGTRGWKHHSLWADNESLQAIGVLTGSKLAGESLLRLCRNIFTDNDLESLRSVL